MSAFHGLSAGKTRRDPSAGLAAVSDVDRRIGERDLGRGTCGEQDQREGRDDSEHVRHGGLDRVGAIRKTARDTPRIPIVTIAQLRRGSRRECRSLDSLRSLGMTEWGQSRPTLTRIDSDPIDSDPEGPSLADARVGVHSWRSAASAPSRGTMRPPRLAALVLLTIPLLAVDARAQRADSIASLRWLAGCLEARSATRVVALSR